MGFLDPYRVVDFTNERGLLAGRMLADLGADVIQVEPLEGSSATTAPRRSPSAYSATCCSLRSSVRATLFPGCEGVRESVRMPRPAASISTCSKPVVPCSSCW